MATGKKSTKHSRKTRGLSPVKSVEWVRGKVRVIDQTKLPHSVSHLELSTAKGVADAIRRLAIRGAPLIGVAAALGVAAEAKRLSGEKKDVLKKKLGEAISILGGTRPTAVNLKWALSRMSRVIEKENEKRLVDALRDEALRILNEDLDVSRRIGEHGASLLPDAGTVYTHCNAGGLATSGLGTALSALYAAKRNGKKLKVIASETRPLLQGARLTAWELSQAGIDVTVICDTASGWAMRELGVSCVLVGADRIARNGDAANKIGTYVLSVLARENGIPFYVLAPTSTIDPMCPSGGEIPIEERSGDEVSRFMGRRVTPRGVKTRNPAFDVTPSRYITAIVTEHGVLRPPFSEGISKVLELSKFS
ncbi:MAG: S-methyl-5-thioribose-1-phosphate isomerase [Candidatus Eisenbacteria bacterium]|nr:S-methyl-5-thioribose-1-phosphate isomerase [Candidatus Eisenbacteria bacterium]